MKISFVRSAEKELLNLDKNISKRVLGKITLPGVNLYGSDSQKLGGGKGYRIRIGDYRVIYTINNKTKTITIFKIRHRREVYR